MTLSTTVNRVVHDGNGVATVFAYPFKILDQAHIRVYLIISGLLTLQTLGTHYTVSGVGAAGGGDITFLSAPANVADSVIFVRDVPLTQLIDYIHNDGFPADTHEEGMDKMVMLAQFLYDYFLRTLHQPEDDADTFTELPKKSLRANTYLYFDANGNPTTAAVALAPGSPIVSAFMLTVLDDATAADACATLTAISSQIVDAKGDLIVATAADTVARLPVGANDKVLVADSSEAGGMAWKHAFVAIPYVMQNMKVVMSTSAGSMTIGFTAPDGTALSASNPGAVYFQDDAGLLVKRNVTSSLAITIPSGATLGTLSGQPYRLYFGILDNDTGDIAEACVWNGVGFAARSGFNFPDVVSLFRVDPNVEYNTQNLTTGSDFAGVIYSTPSRTGSRVLPVAYIYGESAVAGTWLNTNGAEPLSPSSPQTGDILQSYIDVSGEVATGTTIVPMDDTTPTITEGDEYLLIPTLSTFNHESTLVEISWSANFASTVASDGFTGFVHNNAEVLGQSASNIVASGDQVILSGKKFTCIRGQPGNSLGELHFRAGSSAAGTTTFNGRASARLYGGVMSSYMEARFICP